MSFRAPRHRDCTQWLSCQNSILSCCTTQTNKTPPHHAIEQLDCRHASTKQRPYHTFGRRDDTTLLLLIRSLATTLPYPTATSSSFTYCAAAAPSSSLTMSSSTIYWRPSRHANTNTAGPRRYNRGISSSSAGTSRYNSKIQDRLTTPQQK